MRKAPIEAEQSVLGAAMLDAETVLPLLRERCRVEDFTDSKHQLVWRAVLEISGDGRQVDEVTVVTWLKIRGHLDAVGPLYLAQLVERVPTVANVESYADELRRASAARTMYRAASDAMKAIASGAEADEAWATMQLTVRGIEQRAPEQLTDIAPDLDAILREMEKRHETGIAVAPGVFVPTGYKALDDKIVGFAQADLVIVSAKSGIGKTALAINIAGRQAMAGYRPAFFSGEMTRKAIARRLMASTAPVDHSALRSGMFKEPDWPRAVHALGKLDRDRFLINDTVQTIEQVCALTMRAHAQRPLDVVYVDYLQHLVPRADDFKRELAVANAAVQLKNLARKLQVPVIAISQMNDDGTLRESRAIYHTASIVMEVDRPDDGPSNEAVVKIKKNRDGAIGRVTLGWDENSVRFYDQLAQMQAPPQQAGGGWVDSTERD